MRFFRIFNVFLPLRAKGISVPYIEGVGMNGRKKKGLVCFILLAAVLPLSIEAQVNDRLEKGIQLFEARKFSEAKEIFRSLAEENPENATVAFYLGRIFLIEGDHNESINWFKKAVELDKNNSEFHLWLGRAYGQKAQTASVFKKPFLAKKVKKEFEKSVELDPNNIDARFELMLYYLMAPGLMGGSKQKAREQAEEIKKRDAQQGHQALGLVYEFEKKYDQAEKEYLAGIKEDPGNPAPYYRLGYFYGRIKKYDKAFETFERILEIDPEEMNAYYQIGRMGALSGQNLDRAEECLRKYLQSKPKEGSPSLAWAHYRLGMVYEKKGKKQLAKIEYEAALRLDPDHRGAREALKNLK